VSWLGAGIETRLEAKAASFVKEHRLPGAAVGVVHRDALVWSAGIGFADVKSRRAPEATTLYRIASITKTFTGTAVMRLRDAGKLRLDDPVGRYIPELAHLEDVTIRRLLSHESGLQSEPPDTDWRRARYEAAVSDNLARAAEIRAAIPPNSQQKYSNLGFQLLGEIVARASGVPYPDYIRVNLVEPLGLQSTAFEPLPDGLMSRRATGYGGRFASDELEVSSTPPSIGAEGGLWSCVDDLARWLSYQFGDDDTLREMHRPRYLADDTWTEAFGIAWYAVRRGDVTWVQHSGALHGFRSNVCFQPASSVGAVVLLNGLADASLLSMELGEIAREAAAALPAAIEAPKPTPPAFEPLLGIYFDAELGLTRRVEWRDGKLTIVDPDLAAWRPTLAPTPDPDVFVIERGVRESGEHATFRRLPDGRVASVFIAAGTWVRMEPVEQTARKEAGQT